MNDTLTLRLERLQKQKKILATPGSPGTKGPLSLPGGVIFSKAALSLDLVVMCLAPERVGVGEAPISVTFITHF